MGLRGSYTGRSRKDYYKVEFPDSLLQVGLDVGQKKEA